MNSVPHYRLERVYEDGSTDEPQIVPVTRFPFEAAMGRRGFLASVTATSVLAATGCGGAARVGPARLQGSSSAPRYGADSPCGNVRAHDDAIEGLILSGDGSTLLSLAPPSAKVWRLPLGAHFRTIPISAGDQVAASWDGSKAAVVGRTAGGVIHDLNSVSSVTLEPTPSPVVGLAFDRSGSRLITISEDALARLWDTGSGDFLSVVGGAPDLRPVTWHLARDGRWAIGIGGSAGMELVGWDLINGESWFWQTGARVQHVTIPAEAGLFAVLLEGMGAIEVRRLSDGGVVQALEARGVQRLELTQNGAQLIAYRLPDAVEIWPSDGSVVDRALELDDRLAQYAAVSADSIVTADLSGHLRHWRTEAGRVTAVCLVDLVSTTSEAQGTTYEHVETATGRVITYTLPCGSPIPAGATCTCNCVAGTRTAPATQPRPSQPLQRRTRTCSCNTVCTCNRVCTCVPIENTWEDPGGA